MQILILIITGSMPLSVDRIAPEAIRNPVTIELLLSGRLTRHLCYVHVFGRGGCHVLCRLCLLYLEPLGQA